MTVGVVVVAIALGEGLVLVEVEAVVGILSVSQADCVDADVEVVSGPREAIVV